MISRIARSVLAFVLIAAFSTSFAAKPQDPITPFAEVHADVTNGPAPLMVQFSARGSFDPDQGALSYSWDFGDGTTATGLDQTHDYVEGFYVAVLTVTDSQGLFDVTSIEIRVRSDSIPELIITASQVFGSAPLTVAFSSSVIGGDGALTYTWEFGDGDGSSLPNPSHTYVDVGTFTASLTVTDQDGDASAGDLTVFVEAP
jgi:PKD repeat protein